MELIFRRRYYSITCRRHWEQATVGMNYVCNCSRAPELYKIDYRVKMDSDELKKTLMKADVYAFGVLVGEILTGYLETTTYKGNQSKNTVGTTVRIQETCDEQWEIDMEEGYRYRPNALLKQDPGYDGLLK